jgi:hypothetical protein
MYIGKWINKIQQFGYVEITFLAEDDAGILPAYRVDKSFKILDFYDDILKEYYDIEIANAVALAQQVQQSEQVV